MTKGETVTTCANCGEPIEYVEQRWAHGVFRKPDGEVVSYRIACHLVATPSKTEGEAQ